jgi:hypothetical protein
MKNQWSIIILPEEVLVLTCESIENSGKEFWLRSPIALELIS